MKPARRISRRLLYAARGKSHAASLAVLLALLTPGSAHSTQIKDCSVPTPSVPGTCCAKGADWPDGTGYPANPNEETGPNLYRLDKPEPSIYAALALYEYCNTCNKASFPYCDTCSPSSPCTAGTLTWDQRVAAVALYVDNHMDRRNDTVNRSCFKARGYGAYNPGPGEDFPQPADLTLRISGTIINNCAPSNDFEGDCEDFAILRAALLRAAPICLGAQSIWDAIDGSVTHEYNIVEYHNAYRIMDWGTIDRWIQTHMWDAHKSYYGWNQSNGPRGWNAPNNEFLKGQTNNCAKGGTCSIPWSYKSYYKDTCNCP
jgi:hypothetical protein